MDEIIDNNFEIEKLKDYLEKIEICDIILEEVTDELFRKFLSFLEEQENRHDEEILISISENNVNTKSPKPEETSISLWFKILSYLVRFSENFRKILLVEFPNFLKLSTKYFPIERSKPPNPLLLSLLISCLSIRSLEQSQIHIRNQICFSRLSFNLLYHVADLRKNEDMINCIILVTVRLGLEELDRSVEHKFFKNFFSFFLSQIHPFSKYIEERLLYLGMFFNSSNLVRKFCVVGDGKRLVRGIISILDFEIKNKKKFFIIEKLSVLTVEEEKLQKLQISVGELAITTLIDILESPGCPLKSDFFEISKSSKVSDYDYFKNLVSLEGLVGVIKDGCCLVIEAMEDCEDEIENNISMNNINERTDEENEYFKKWQEEFEIIAIEDKKRKEILRVLKVKETEKVEEQLKIEKKIVEEEKKEEEELIQKQERNRRRDAYEEKMNQLSRNYWMKIFEDQEAWLNELKNREKREEEAAERVQIERKRMRGEILRFQSELKIFSEIMRIEKQENIKERLEKIRMEREEREKKRKIEMVETGKIQKLLLSEINSRMNDRRTNFRSIDSPLSPVGDSFENLKKLAKLVEKEKQEKQEKKKMNKKNEKKKKNKKNKKSKKEDDEKCSIM